MGEGPAPGLQVLDSLYLAGPDTMLEACAAHIPSASVTALVVGHNPTVASVAEMVRADDGGVLEFPTSGLVVYALSNDWADLGPSCGSVVATHTPKN